MKILEYFRATGFKDATDKTLNLARELEDLTLKIKEIKIQLHQKTSVDVETMEVVKAAGADSLSKDLLRWKKQKDEILKKIEKIQKFAAERGTFSCPSEAVHTEHQLKIMKATMDVEANDLCTRTIKKYKNCIPKMIELSLADDPSITDSSEQLKRGCILESRKLHKVKDEIDAAQQKLDNWLAYRDEILEFISKVCPDDANS